MPAIPLPLEDCGAREGLLPKPRTGVGAVTGTGDTLCIGELEPEGAANSGEGAAVLAILSTRLFLRGSSGDGARGTVR